MTDIQRDIDIAKSLIGKPNSYFEPIYKEFASNWDGVPCSEIACCISYLAGNLSTIKVSNYAEGLVSNFKKMWRFDHFPMLGAFIFFGSSKPDHTGRVIEVRPKTIITIEGNVNGKVVKREYNRDYKYIYGYGYPLYSLDTNYLFEKAVMNSIYLKKGDADKDLTFWLQMYLYNRGYYSGDLDGDYGDYTAKAVKAFQGDNNLTFDGEVGYYTLKKILEG